MAFFKVPRGYWQQKKNQIAYLMWLEQELGFIKPTDWYQISRDDTETITGFRCFLATEEGPNKAR